MDRRTLPLLVLPLAALFALTACTPGGGSGDDSSPDPAAGETDSGDGAAGPVLTSCVTGDWQADLDDLVQQIADQFGGNGMPIESATASGTQGLSIDGEGVLGFANDAIFAIGVDLGDGLVMTVTQHHTGNTGADWAWDGGADASDTTGTMRFSNFENSDYNVENTVTINGESADSAIPLPEQPAADVPLEVACSGDTLTTHPQGTPFTTTWHR